MSYLLHNPKVIIRYVSSVFIRCLRSVVIERHKKWFVGIAVYDFSYAK